MLLEDNGKLGVFLSSCRLTDKTKICLLNPKNVSLSCFYVVCLYCRMLAYFCTNAGENMMSNKTDVRHSRFCGDHCQTLVSLPVGFYSWC